MKFALAALLFTLPAHASVDCSPYMRANGPRTCAAMSHGADTNIPRKECTWSVENKQCTCCIYNESASEREAGSESSDEN